VIFWEITKSQEPRNDLSNEIGSMYFSCRSLKSVKVRIHPDIAHVSGNILGKVQSRYRSLEWSSECLAILQSISSLMLS
jgi:hypothetical protein